MGNVMMHFVKTISGRLKGITPLTYCPVVYTYRLCGSRKHITFEKLGVEVTVVCRAFHKSHHPHPEVPPNWK